MKQIPKLTPWINDEEFNTVFNWLYSEPGHPNRLLGVKRVKAWVCRGKVPHSVVATSQLVEVVEREIQNQNAPIQYQLSHLELRLMFSTAFIRGVTDSERKGVYMTAVSTLAEKMNLPLWWVDLRHQATHDSVPSLPQLKEATYGALEWLRDNYWDVPEPEMISDDEIIEAINKYKLTRKNYLKGLDIDTLKESFIDYTPGSDGISELIKRIKNESGAEQIISILLQSGFLVPQRKKKRQTMEDLDLSIEALVIWKPILLQLNSNFPNFMDELAQTLLKEVTKNQINLSKTSMLLLGYDTSEIDSPNSMDSTGYPTYIAWIIQLMKWDLMVKKKIGFGIDWEEVQTFCLENPNVYTFKVLKTMIGSDETLSERISTCLPFIEKYIESISESSNVTKRELDLESEKAEVDNLIKKFKTGNSDSSLGSVLNSDSNMKSIPFGVLNNNQFPNLDLPLEFDSLPPYIPAYLKL
ncbi:Las1-domain-containing protein [Conidiobolus coronatus NRRL 28638]|uniref:Las1-domain-containing protein n=1 Tax=Conidiobolus coronatus (strain ATCC 28846 / CBS 209.66 / NRRL 28638) TaxID=796925 RepID=A0A137P6L2_CONC2|nr:Las1-domain-containing protein [Conidiobolus coronatus NRRL 28638]|eukprot:KXN70561.1 Las1-domain-containing protein [Conidiobolus coronatus NRRL 28638]